MMRVKCNVCHGEYEQELPDRSRYFHACPPYSAAEAAAAIAAGAVTLTPAQRKQLDDARAADTKAPRPTGERSRVDDVLVDLAIPRPNARNENVRGSAAGGDPTTPIAPGTGFTKIGADAPIDRKI